MAALKTTVSSPAGPITSLPGRVPDGEALAAAKRRIEAVIEIGQRHLAQIEAWQVETSRGTMKVLGYHELERTMKEWISTGGKD